MAAASLWFLMALSAFCIAAAVIATPLPNANANEDQEEEGRLQRNGGRGRRKFTACVVVVRRQGLLLPQTTGQIEIMDFQ